MLLFTYNVKKIKRTAHINSDVDGTCKWALSVVCKFQSNDLFQMYQAHLE